MKRRLLLLAAGILPGILIMFGSGYAQAAPARHLNLANVEVQNSGSLDNIFYHGQGNPLTVALGGGSTLSQINCGSYFVAGGWITACQFENANHLCMTASTSDGIVRAYPCSEDTRQQFWGTTDGPNGQGQEPFWWWNVYWGQQGQGLEYMVQTSSGENAEVGANYGAGSAQSWYFLST